MVSVDNAFMEAAHLPAKWIFPPSPAAQQPEEHLLTTFSFTQS